MQTCNKFDTGSLNYYLFFLNIFSKKRLIAKGEKKWLWRRCLGNVNILNYTVSIPLDLVIKLLTYVSRRKKKAFYKKKSKDFMNEYWCVIKIIIIDWCNIIMIDWSIDLY